MPLSLSPEHHTPEAGHLLCSRSGFSRSGSECQHATSVHPATQQTNHPPSRDDTRSRCRQDKRRGVKLDETIAALHSKLPAAPTRREGASWRPPVLPLHLEESYALRLMRPPTDILRVCRRRDVRTGQLHFSLSPDAVPSSMAPPRDEVESADAIY